VAWTCETARPCSKAKAGESEAELELHEIPVAQSHCNAFLHEHTGGGARKIAEPLLLSLGVQRWFKRRGWGGIGGATSGSRASRWIKASRCAAWPFHEASAESGGWNARVPRVPDRGEFDSVGAGRSPPDQCAANGREELRGRSTQAPSVDSLVIPGVRATEPNGLQAEYACGRMMRAPKTKEGCGGRRGALRSDGRGRGWLRS